MVWNDLKKLDIEDIVKYINKKIYDKHDLMGAALMEYMEKYK